MIDLRTSKFKRQTSIWKRVSRHFYIQFICPVYRMKMLQSSQAWTFKGLRPWKVEHRSLYQGLTKLQGLIYWYFTKNASRIAQSTAINFKTKRTAAKREYQQFLIKPSALRNSKNRSEYFYSCKHLIMIVVCVLRLICNVSFMLQSLQCGVGLI